MRILIYYAHPGHRYSRVNSEMALVARKLAQNYEEISFCDLYEVYPRFDIEIDVEQKKLLEHDVIIFQHPLFWYSTPSLMKEWIDLVLEHGFAFGAGGKNLEGKIFMNAISASAPVEAYTPEGYQNYPLRTFLTPLEQTAKLCHMKYSSPYVLYSAIKAQENLEIKKHCSGYENLLKVIVEDRYDFDQALKTDFITAESLGGFIKGMNK